jgi:hypothetical protein
VTVEPLVLFVLLPFTVADVLGLVRARRAAGAPA